MQGCHYDANRDGWLTLNGGALRNNNSMCITLNADNWNEVGSYRVLGKYSNDMHWLIENRIE